ncbi:hypothetical protein Q31b_50240 [Novipirellula aureliae]|uniref:Uncharacterized protein n=1 Tax=Novipirellula aureliae TaxID=2527966 RepID=A0A5C6DJG6_9BACT|nr:hypothetical protein Q31b_50240 [Novipirellula aureliae]
MPHAPLSMTPGGADNDPDARERASDRFGRSMLFPRPPRDRRRYRIDAL